MRWCTLASFCWLAMGCSFGVAESQQSQTYLGTVEGSDVVVAAVVANDSWTLYSCGGPSTYATHSFWLSGVAPGDGMTAAAAGNSARATVQNDGTVDGTLTVDGVTSSFALSRAPDDGLSGLYSTLDGDCRTGAVVMMEADGRPRVQGTWCQGDRFEQVTPARSLELLDGRLVVLVPAIGERELRLDRVVR